MLKLGSAAELRDVRVSVAVSPVGETPVMMTDNSSHCGILGSKLANSLKQIPFTMLAPVPALVPVSARPDQFVEEDLLTPKPTPR